MVTYLNGPMVGVEYEPMTPKGVVLVNKPEEQVIIYDVQLNDATQTQYKARDGVYTLNREDGEKNIIRAASERNYDVLAYDPERMGPWQL